MEDIIELAIEGINRNIYGRFLLNEYPVILTSNHNRPEMEALLRQHESPACTDGKEVFISATVTEDLLNRQYKEYEQSAYYKREEEWLCKTIDGSERNLSRSGKIAEVKCILLHELTHALNEHGKLKLKYRKASDAYQRRLMIACEIQANDGLLGEHFARLYTQQVEGVINKRQHPETLNCHTLASIMNHLKVDNSKQSMQQQQRAKRLSDLMEEAMKATGEYERVKQQLQDEASSDNIERSIEQGADDNEQKTSDDILKSAVKELGNQAIREIILSCLNEDLHYDATTNSVFYDEVKKRTRTATYARPNKKYIGNTIIKKGYKTQYEKERNKSRKLVVLAVDGSGSMRHMQYQVERLMNDLLKQVRELADEMNITVDYKNLLACVHRDYASELYYEESEMWKDKMRRYEAVGGNCFGRVLERIDKDVNIGDYEAITVIDLGDGLDTLTNTGLSDAMFDMINDGRVKWVDAIIEANDMLLNNCINDDTIKIRESYII